jgi:tRNA threonylcarbamoyladenosine biosynthesis protein TsaE
VGVRVVETAGSEETESLGAELAQGLRLGDVVLVRGEVGSGKTTLVRGAARALGVEGPVPSPTFVIGHRHPGTLAGGSAGAPAGRRVTVSHLDLYRLEDLQAEDPALLEDYLGGERIAFVEWPLEGSAALDAARMRVTLSHLGGDRRRIEVSEQ